MHITNNYKSQNIYISLNIFLMEIALSYAFYVI